MSAIFVVGGIAAGCGSSSDGSQVNGSNGDGSAAASGGAALVGLPGTGSGSGTGTTPVIDPSAACAKGTASATLSGVNMFVMFDRSSSMTERANQNGTRWALTSSALNAFFASPNAAGLQLALRFFPHDSPSAGCNQDRCDLNACATPLVGLGGLSAAAAPADAQEAALINATARSAPGMSGQGTPIFAALGGALQWASAQRQKTPDQNSVVVLVTDGQANGCETDIGRISALAAKALADDGIRTYAIGLTGSEEADMTRIAVAGGTTKGIFVSDGVNTQQELLDALGAIRGQVLDCDFAMPVAKPGLVVDKTLINVNYTPTGGMSTTLPRVANEAACTTSGGWFYDDPNAPTRITLCKSSCDQVTVDPSASLDILLGCATAIEVPK
ncbi:MAG TPA: vWA domain-containing protein [Polyangiaceae bacterium]|nr:vWA domain-containing protein [Polyangiaceae bacterium]